MTAFVRSAKNKVTLRTVLTPARITALGGLIDKILMLQGMYPKK